MAVIPQLVRCRRQSFRVCLDHALRFREGMGQKGPEAVNIEQRSFNTAPKTAAHHVQSGGQMEQGMPP